MDGRAWSDEKIDQLTAKAAEHAWERREKHLRAIGIASAEKLKQMIAEGIRDPKTRSFDRQPDPLLGQTERSQIFQIEHRNQDKTHVLTVVLNPDLDDLTGQTHGGTVTINDPKRHPDFSRWISDEYEKERAPKVLARGQNAGTPESQAQKSPVSRLEASLKREPTMIEKMQERQKAQQQEQPQLGQQQATSRDREIER